MRFHFTKANLSLLIVLSILIIDQIIKIWIKTNMHYGESIRITDWFYLYFVENMGMAFGIQILPKIVQTIFRIIFACAILRCIASLVKTNVRTGFIVCISMILAGAVGNIIDSIFYGVIFSESTLSGISTFVPIGDGYTGWLQGKVVDMFYFPLLEFYWPGWIPFIGGDKFIFFSPIFNFADASISCGFIIMLLFYKKDLNNKFSFLIKPGKDTANSENKLVG